MRPDIASLGIQIGRVKIHHDLTWYDLSNTFKLDEWKYNMIWHDQSNIFKLAE